jgi:hypothetical protein
MGIRAIKGQARLRDRIEQPSTVGRPFRPRATSSNEPFGSRPEPGVHVITSILLSPPGEAPEGRARGVQDTAAQLQSESER